MKILHLFDLYLPHTMNWAQRMIQATPDTEARAAAPWVVRNAYFGDGKHVFIRPLQWLTGFIPRTEWEWPRLVGLLLRLEHRRPWYRNWLQKRLKKDKQDVLHAHFAPIGYHYLPMAKALGIPLVVSFYGYDYESLTTRKPEWKARYLQLFEQAAAVVCLGPHGRDVLIAQGCPPDKIHIVPMSIDLQAFPMIQRHKQPRTLRLVQVATIKEKKGFWYTLQAFQAALAHCPHLHLTIAGEQNDHALQQRMQDFIRNKHLENNITWRGFVPNDALPAFFAGFDVFIHPSRYTEHRDSEGAPAVILEAQATGLPVIATRHADIPMEVLHEKTGLLVPERDVPALAACIERFYHMESEEYSAFSQAARAHVERFFDVRKNAVLLRGIYGE
ncbi:MAG: glycosyltransferase [Bacteroidetes bacterium]|nr:glycosyltransferase [Bacteroidota bacterium]